MQIRTENGLYVVTISQINEEKIPQKILELEEKNRKAINSGQLHHTLEELSNSPYYAVGCSDARYPGIFGMPNSFMAGARNDSNPDDFRLDNKKRIQVDHDDSTGNGCGGRANAKNHLKGQVLDSLYQELAKGINPDPKENALEGAGDNGIALTYNHLTGKVDFLKILNNRSISLPQEALKTLETLPIIIEKNLNETGKHNSRTDFLKEQDPKYLVLNLALGTLGQYIGSELPKSLGDVFEVKPYALGHSLVAYEPNAAAVGSIMYALDSRAQTLNGHPHGFNSMDTFILLFPCLNNCNEQTPGLIGGLFNNMLNIELRLGQHLTYKNIEVYGLGVTEKGLILPSNVYSVSVTN